MNRYTLQANAQVLQDLVDCLWAEDFFAGEDTGLEPAERWHRLHCQASSNEDPLTTPNQVWRWQPRHPHYRTVLVPARPGIAQPLLSLPGAPVYGITRRDRIKRLEAIDLMRLVAEALGEKIPGRSKGTELFIDALAATLEQTAWSYRHRIRTRDLLALPPAAFFQVMEQWGALRDRPYHPVAKAKLGLNRDDYHHYVAEFDQTIPLKWVALPRDRTLVGKGVVDEDEPADYILDVAQQRQLREELTQRELNHHIAIPVLAWQLEHGLPEDLQHDGDAGHWIPLDFQGPGMKSTSSVRSLAPLDDSPNYLKLPMSVYSLGSSRYLPAVKMMNGVIAENLLRRALPKDPVVNERIRLCDETRWWAYMPPDASLFDDYPRHLSAMVRRYPADLLQDPDLRLIPMSALGTTLPGHRAHFFDDWLAYRRLPADEASVLTLFREVCDGFLEWNLRLFRLGILPEIHGQNAVLVWRDGRVDGLLLRDHDSLRIFVPWLEQAGLEDPVFRLKKGVANTLYHDRPEDLLFYLLTLGIQVNLRAILGALATRYDLYEGRLWRVLRDSLERMIDQVPFDESARSLLWRECFEADRWPLKLLIRPMLERAGGPGSMPFGKGELANPFKRLGPSPDTTLLNATSARETLA